MRIQYSTYIRVCRALKDGAIKTKSSAYARILTTWFATLQLTPASVTARKPRIMSLTYLENKYGDKTPPCRVPLLMYRNKQITVYHYHKVMLTHYAYATFIPDYCTSMLTGVMIGKWIKYARMLTADDFRVSVNPGNRMRTQNSAWQKKFNKTLNKNEALFTAKLIEN